MTGEFKISVLASGSKGNATIITAGGKNFLIDAGISCRQLTQRIKETGMQPEDLDGVLLTHEHRDHISGLPVFSRKYHFCTAQRNGTQLLPSAAKMSGNGRAEN